MSAIDLSSHFDSSNSIQNNKRTVKFLDLTRPQLFSIMLVLTISNALFGMIAGALAAYGIVYSLANTFEVSAVVWSGIYIGLRYAARIEEGPITYTDKLVAATVFLACLLPLGPATWAVLSALALYMIVSARDPHKMQAHAGWVMLAISVPMFWSKRFFNLFSEFFLSLDARLVSSITQTERTSNLVAMPGGKGFLQIAAPCSSMANLSLALLCWVLFTQAFNLKWRPRNVLWCMTACLSVVAINVSRISLIGFFPERYELIHGPIGSTVTSWLILVTTVSICYYGVKDARNQSV